MAMDTVKTSEQKASYSKENIISKYEDLIKSASIKPKTPINPMNKSYQKTYYARENQIISKLKEDARINAITVLKNADPTELEKIDRMFKEFFDTQGMNEESLKTFSNACKTTANKLRQSYGAKEIPQITALDIYSNLPAASGITVPEAPLGAVISQMLDARMLTEKQSGKIIGRMIEPSIIKEIGEAQTAALGDKNTVGKGVSPEITQKFNELEKRYNELSNVMHQENPDLEKFKSSLKDYAQSYTEFYTTIKKKADEGAANEKMAGGIGWKEGVMFGTALTVEVLSRRVPAVRKYVDKWANARLEKVLAARTATLSARALRNLEARSIEALKLTGGKGFQGFVSRFAISTGAGVLLGT
ncbi:MAG: hypothetical protein NTY68_04100, partial [Candidatus Micrarchaeota archaeon]|nr:hypothetical protein [Candidatus Micrarchaeota archaeon]